MVINEKHSDMTEGAIPTLLKMHFLGWNNYRFVLSYLFLTAFSQVSPMSYINFIIRIRRHKL